MRLPIVAVVVLLVSVPAVAVPWDPSGLQGVPVTQLEEDYVGRTGIYASTLGSGVQISTDDGRTWGPWNEGLGSDSVRAIASVAPFGAGKCPYSLFYAATPMGVWCRWTEDASMADSVWHQANEGLSELDVTAVATDGSWEAVCGTRGGALFRRSFEDTCWQSIGSPLFGSGPILSVEVAWVWMSGACEWGIYVVSGGAQGDGLFRSMDWGQTWYPLSVGEPVWMAQHVCEACIVAGCAGGAMGRSWDGGDTWQLFYLFPPSATCTCYLPAAGAHAWGGADSGGVVHTINGWSTWYSWGGESLGVRCLHATQTDLVAATDTGVYRVQGAPADDPPLPGSPLLKLRPNPSPRGPTRALVSGAEGPVRVVVHDLLGRRLYALSPLASAPGVYSLRFDGCGELGPGTYVCSAEVEGQTISQRFTVTGP